MGDVRPAAGKPGTQQARDLAGQPVMREEEVVVDALALGELGDPRRKTRHLVVERVLVKPATGRQVDDPRQWCELLD